MSEKEKSRRARYKKNREKWIFIQSALIVLLSLAVLISAIVSYQLKKTYYIDYDESGKPAIPHLYPGGLSGAVVRIGK